jgi:putative PIN family toxin of toxin-antitoxin system
MAERGSRLVQYYVVIDTNVLVSAMLKADSIPGQIVNEALIGNAIPLLNNEILAEYQEVLKRPKFKFATPTVRVLLEGIIERGIFLDAGSIEEMIPDQKDVVFYRVVMEGRKGNRDAYLVTGNIKHFPEKTYVVTPREMLDIMNKTNEE